MPKPEKTHICISWIVVLLTAFGFGWMIVKVML